MSKFQNSWKEKHLVVKARENTYSWRGLTHVTLTFLKAAMMTSPALPQFLQGEVVKGFGRGSKQLGCPTANYNIEVVKSLPRELKPGVYYGWAQVDSGPVHKMVTNIGWCPFYQNKEMSVETHVIHKFEEDFYGSCLKIAIVGYLRGEKNFDSLDDLIEAIQQDIEKGAKKLDEPEAKEIKKHAFFSS